MAEVTTTTSVDQIADRIKDIISTKFSIEKSKISDKTSFLTDIGMDSLETVELVMEFEQEFNCEISDEIAKKMLTIKAAADCIASLMPNSFD